ncbi:hypothetical protein LZ32DRAFT_602992 [Colletotrichum eremochloae]|nr:hypothetical protein LZ32DRAFT_602992 [Colletotrichum eremochloae]
MYLQGGLLSLVFCCIANANGSIPFIIAYPKRPHHFTHSSPMRHRRLVSLYHRGVPGASDLHRQRRPFSHNGGTSQVRVRAISVSTPSATSKPS